MAVALGTSLIDFPQSSSSRLLVMIVDFTSCRRMMTSKRYSPNRFSNCFIPMSSIINRSGFRYRCQRISLTAMIFENRYRDRDRFGKKDILRCRKNQTAAFVLCEIVCDSQNVIRTIHCLADLLFVWYEQRSQEGLYETKLHADGTSRRVSGNTHCLWCFTGTNVVYYPDRSKSRLSRPTEVFHKSTRRNADYRFLVRVRCCVMRCSAEVLAPFIS